MIISWRRLVIGLLAAAALTVVGLTTTGLAQGGRGGLTLVATSAADVPDPFNIDPKKGPVDMGLTDPALVGAFDIHAHLEPSVERTMDEGGFSVDFVEQARMARMRGMRGYAQKSVSDASSAVNAYMIRKYIAPELEVFGRFPMNLSTGGINIASMVHFANIKGGWGRIIEMPTWDAEFRNIPPRAPKQENRPWMVIAPQIEPKFVSVAKNGELLPEVKQLLEVAVKIRTADSNGKLVLATGHTSGLETLLLAREAHRLGMQITSPHGAQELKGDQLTEYVNLGGYLEIRNVAGSPKNAKEYADLVRKIGPASVIISSDCGFMNYPTPVDCMALIAQSLRSQDISERDLDVMFKENPAKLLGLPIKRTPPVTMPPSTK